MKIKTNEKGEHYDPLWKAMTNADDAVNRETAYGPTMLIAAMRCHIGNYFGSEVDIPEELL